MIGLIPHPISAEDSDTPQSSSFSCCPSTDSGGSPAFNRGYPQPSLHPHFRRAVKGWFSILTRKALKNRAFTSVAELTDAIEHWAAHPNHNPKPLRWTKQAQPVLDKIKRAQTSLNRATKPATHH